MDETTTADQAKKGRNAGRIIVIIVLAAAIAAVFAFLVWPKIQQADKPDPSFVVLHSFPEGSPQAEYIEKTALPALERQYSDIEAAALYLDESRIDSETLRMKNEGKAPDVLFLAPEAMAGLAGFGVLEPFDGEGAATELLAVREEYAGGYTSAGVIEGVAYGIPIDVSALVLLYNPGLLAGGEPPANLDSLWGMLSKPSSDGGDVAGFILPDAGMKSLAPFVWSSGGELVNGDGAKAYGYLNDAGNAAVFDGFAAAIEGGAIIVAGGKDEALAQFAAGAATMTLADTSDLLAFDRQYPDFRYEAIAFPAGASGSVTVLGCKYVSVSKDARKDAVAAFLSDMLSSGAMGADPPSGIPAASLASGRPLPMSWSMADMQNEFLLAMKQITDGYKTTQQALDDLAMKWDAYLP